MQNGTRTHQHDNAHNKAIGQLLRRKHITAEEERRYHKHLTQSMQYGKSQIQTDTGHEALHNIRIALNN